MVCQGKGQVFWSWRKSYHDGCKHLKLGHLFSFSTNCTHIHDWHSFCWCLNARYAGSRKNRTSVVLYKCWSKHDLNPLHGPVRIACETRHPSGTACSTDVALIKTKMIFAGHLWLVTGLFLHDALCVGRTGSGVLRLVSGASENRCCQGEVTESFSCVHLAPHVFLHKLSSPLSHTLGPVSLPSLVMSLDSVAAWLAHSALACPLTPGFVS